MRFGICLAVRSIPRVLKSKFCFQLVPALDRHGVDVARNDILQNYVSRSDQLMNSSTPWAGSSWEVHSPYANAHSNILIFQRRRSGLHRCYRYTSIHIISSFLIFKGFLVSFKLTRHWELFPFYFIGSSIHACRNVHHHIAALEPDVEVYQTL